MIVLFIHNLKNFGTNNQITFRPFQSIMTGIKEFHLKKDGPGCTGMFWRPDPTGKTNLASNSEWPRDGAMLRGTVVSANGKEWLLTTHVKQAQADWIPAPAGAAMPFRHAQYYLEEA
jgi:hypothetical protein